MIVGNEYFTLEIETENEIFQDRKGMEIAIVLRQLANRIDMLKIEHDDEYVLHDGNGNIVGKATLTIHK